MSFRVLCPCGAKLNIKDELAGNRRDCPKCNRELLLSPTESDQRIDWQCPVCEKKYRIPSDNLPDFCPSCEKTDDSPVGYVVSEDSPDLVIFECVPQVSGTQFSQKAIETFLSIRGNQITWKRVADNEHDEKAVSIRCKNTGNHLGWIPGSMSQRINKWFDCLILELGKFTREDGSLAIAVKIIGPSNRLKEYLNEIAQPNGAYSENKLRDLYIRYAGFKGWSTSPNLASEKVESWTSSTSGPVGLAITFHETGKDECKHIGEDAEATYLPTVYAGECYKCSSSVLAPADIFQQLGTGNETCADVECPTCGEHLYAHINEPSKFIAIGSHEWVMRRLSQNGTSNVPPELEAFQSNSPVTRSGARNQRATSCYWCECSLAKGEGWMQEVPSHKGNPMRRTVCDGCYSRAGLDWNHRNEAANRENQILLFVGVPMFVIFLILFIIAAVASTL